MGSSSKLNYQIYKYILQLDMQNNYILYSMDTKDKRNLTTVCIVNIWVNQHNIRIEDSNAMRYISIYVPEFMINTSKHGTLVYIHTLDAHIM